MNQEHTEKLKAIVEKCDRCGACTTVCPLYKVNRIDRATGAKIAIARAFLEGKLDGGESPPRRPRLLLALQGLHRGLSGEGYDRPSDD